MEHPKVGVTLNRLSRSLRWEPRQFPRRIVVLYLGPHDRFERNQEIRTKSGNQEREAQRQGVAGIHRRAAELAQPDLLAQMLERSERCSKLRTV